MEFPRDQFQYPYYILNINSLPSRINTLLEPVVSADETGVIFSSKNFDDLRLMP
jgi:hypothetical protein